VDVAFYLPGGVPLYTFSLLLGVGSSLGLLWVARQAPRKRVSEWVNAGLLTLLGGLVGGRAVFVVFNWSYFQTRILEVPQVWLGGFAWPGALGGALISLVLIAALTRQPLGALADGLLPLMASVPVSVWLGCWVDGVAYGPQVSAWWGVPARDEWGEIAFRWPLQPLGALLTVVVFWSFEVFKQRSWLNVPGRAFSLGLGALSLILFGLSFLRVDPAPFWRGQRLETWTAFGFFALAGLAFLATFAKRVKLSDG
jgi:prolipoprotein diacylglyceryltransferase